MSEACRLTLCTAAATFRATLRLRSFLLCSLLTVAASALGTLPVSPGLTAGEEHYLQAGLATLLLGTVATCLVALPRVLPAARGRWKEEAVLALPLPPEVLTVGAWAGFSAALSLAFLIGGAAYLAIAAKTCAAAAADNLLAPLLFALLLGLVTAALVTALHGFLPPAAALVGALLLVLAGQAAAWWPLFPGVLLPPFDRLGSDLLPGGKAAVPLPSFVHGIATLFFYLAAAVTASRRPFFSRIG